MTKKIIVRIIVSVLVCVILSKLKVLGIANVHALEVWSPSPTNVCYYNSIGEQVGCPASEMTTLAAYIPFRNSLYNSTGGYFGNISANYNRSDFSSLTNKTFVASFIFATTSHQVIAETETNITAILKNGNNVSYCTVMESYIDSYGWKYFPVNCPNAFLGSTNNLTVLINSFNGFEGPANFAFSNLTMIYDNDLVLAQNTANTRLNDIKNQLQSTNQKLDNTNNTLNSILSGITSSNGIQTQIQNNTKETNDLLKSDEGVSNSDIQSVLDSQDESNSPITDLVSMPLTLLNKINTGFSSSCSPFSLGTLYGEELVLPCINLSSRLGSLWSIIDIFFSIFMAYNIGMMCIRIYNNLTTLKDDSNSVYGGGN